MPNIRIDTVLESVQTLLLKHIIATIRQRYVLCQMTANKITSRIISLNIVFVNAPKMLLVYRLGATSEPRLVYKSVMVLFGVMIQLAYLYVLINVHLFLCAGLMM